MPTEVQELVFRCDLFTQTILVIPGLVTISPPLLTTVVAIIFK